jgi:hypothetical protein
MSFYAVKTKYCQLILDVLPCHNRQLIFQCTANLLLCEMFLYINHTSPQALTPMILKNHGGYIF